VRHELYVSSVNCFINNSHWTDIGDEKFCVNVARGQFIKESIDIGKFSSLYEDFFGKELLKY
jgi:hypothetical protein